ncbi:hypothetical protein [Flagellimonas eckloniae]|uniref:Uncharacterized protein n=1 Tax=Flagellimonas eckloniae TaxID=346185 RepID=A0A0Q0XGH4_9FLAO|nr:hypothetical protein [Allomuricauda eckloniae]KQC30186.1 hypothetical protein AAY42_10085 [Allomuricauda eckloniae]
MPVQLLLIWLAFARKTETKNKLRLRIGAFYLKRGAGVQVGQPIKLRATGKRPKRQMWVENLYYNFKLNTVTHTLSKTPIKGHSEPFIEAKKNKAA